MNLSFVRITKFIIGLTTFVSAIYGLYVVILRFDPDIIKDLGIFIPVDKEELSTRNRREIFIKAVDFINSVDVCAASNDTAQYGDVVLNCFPHIDRPNAATWKIEVDKKDEGFYCLSVRYATQDPRPVSVVLNGIVERRKALNVVTNGFTMQYQRLVPIGVLKLDARRNDLTLMRDHGFPHISEIILKPVSSKSAFCE